MSWFLTTESTPDLLATKAPAQPSGFAASLGYIQTGPFGHVTSTSRRLYAAPCERVWRDVSGIVDLEHAASPRLFGRERCVDDRRSVEPGRVDRKRGQSSLEANERWFVQRLREEFGTVLVEIKIEGLIELFKHVDAGSRGRRRPETASRQLLPESSRLRHVQTVHS
jgi:hypothetical protein